MFNEIKELHLKARVQRDIQRSSLLGLIVGEVETAAKRDVSVDKDSLTECAVKKLITAAEKNISVVKGDDQIPFITERDYLKSLLDTYGTVLMTKEQIIAYLSENSPQNVGEAMKLLRQECSGKYDAKMASIIAKDLLG